MKKELLYVGMDVHSREINLAVAEAGRGGEVRHYGTISSDLHAVEKTFSKLGHPRKELKVCYEAGPHGFVLARRLRQLGIDCVVVAPSKTPKGSGERVKTDRRDALKLARLHRAGELTAVHIPDARDEAIRDLCRARTDAVYDQRSARQQLKSFLLRHGYRYSGKSPWSEAHQRYLRELVLPHPAMKIVLEEYLQAVEAAASRVERLEKHMEDQLREWRLEPVVRALMGLKGYQMVAAMIVVSELGDIHRFDHPRQLMAYLGLVPAENSTGSRRCQGSITKAGNGHLRWIINECAQHYRLPPKVSSQLSKRQAAVDANHRRQIKEISWRCQNRLYQRYRKLSSRGKMRQKVQVALARELCSFVWEILTVAMPTPLGCSPAVVAGPPAARKGKAAITRLRSA